MKTLGRATGRRELKAFPTVKKYLWDPLILPLGICLEGQTDTESILIGALVANLEKLQIITHNYI